MIYELYRFVTIVLFIAITIIWGSILIGASDVPKDDRPYALINRGSDRQ